MKGRRDSLEWVVVGVIFAALAGAWVIYVLPYADGRRSVLSIVAGESIAVVVLAAIVAALWSRKPWVFLLLLPLGVAIGVAATGVYFFGELGDRKSMTYLGQMSAIYFGLPLGLTATIFAWLAWRF